MLQLHHDHRQAGASGRTRTDEYEFTKLVLWLLRHRGKMVSTAGIAPATSTFARWRSDLTELRGQLALSHLASVIGLAPIRPDLKGRLRELLCIHGLLAYGHEMVPKVGIAPTSPRLQRGANLPQLLGGWLADSKLGERRLLVVPAGNAPASSGSHPGA